MPRLPAWLWLFGRRRALLAKADRAVSRLEHSLKRALAVATAPITAEDLERELSGADQDEPTRAARPSAISRARR